MQNKPSPLVVTLAPVLAAAPAIIVGGAIGLGIAYLLNTLFDNATKEKPEAVPVKTDAETSRKPAEIGVFHEIPAGISVQTVPAFRPQSALSAIPSAHAAQKAVAVPAASVIQEAVQPVVPVAKPILPAAPKPLAKKSISRADMAAVFDKGKRSLTRTAAVGTLRRLGFGKSAAYAALSPDGRFNTWLRCAPDGIISWIGELTA